MKARRLWEGYVYRGSKFPELYGKYIYADYGTRNVSALDISNPDEPKAEFLSKSPFGGRLAGVGKDANNELYFIRFANYQTTDGRIYTLEKSTQSVIEPPATLSETGAFANVSSLAPGPGLIPYDVIAPLWSDGTDKKRWFVVANDGAYKYSHQQIKYSENGDWIFPSGSVFIKHFEYKGRKLETRFLVRSADAGWYGLSYKWRDDQTDADLMASEGETASFRIAGEDFTWRFPSRTECFECHTDVSGGLLGVKTRQLNKSILYPRSGKVANQLDSYAHIGLFGADFDESQFDDVMTSAHISNEDVPRAFRIRSYLDSNCAHCHQPGGPAEGLFDARLTTDLEDQGILAGPVIFPLEIDEPYVLSPGKPASSLLYVRMNSLEEGVAMPPLAKHKLDTEAIGLLEKWIVELGDGEPVETSIEAQASGNQVHLVWFAESEMSDVGFEVERRTRRTPYQTIGYVEVKQSADGNTRYEYTDTAPVNNGEVLFYRIKQIGANGGYEYTSEFEIQLEKPLRAQLHDNYPNPFNPSTTIEYDVPAPLQVSLMIYDNLGREVETLVDADQPPGRYQVTFNAGDLPSGTYFYQLIAGDTKVTKKLVLLR